MKPEIEKYVPKHPDEISYDADFVDMQFFNEEFIERWNARPPQDADAAEALIEDVLYHGLWPHKAAAHRDGERQDQGKMDAKEDRE